ncbi:pentapeptide repeat-containing protein [Bifidobacterium pullorum subsp. saeculare]|uniref:Pentapeptide repeat-containing protein n=1 Tax=Bifidobacterium pullorum subsp. saeculare TaxID=78257 RepID=A0A938WW43_9BIFI|nr:pentapeptide repeat-containing protein [Bifidobacterium pullorum]MBM6699970.1 pentapeptide repeat-containing protein [Bifidobacterium pullorum subsp. saeculare]
MAEGRVGALEPEGTYDGLRFSGAMAADIGDAAVPAVIDCTLASFLGCGLDAIAAESLVLDRARLTGTDLTGCSLAEVSLAGATLDDVRVTASRLGAATAIDSVLRVVEFDGCRIDYLNLRGAQWRDVTFRDCRIGVFDAADARLTRLAFPGTAVASLDLRHARLQDVDLRGARLRGIAGVEHLAGATMDLDQIAGLAAAFASSIGIRLE